MDAMRMTNCQRILQNTKYKIIGFQKILKNEVLFLKRNKAKKEMVYFIKFLNNSIFVLASRKLTNVTRVNTESVNPFNCEFGCTTRLSFQQYNSISNKIFK